MIDENEKPKLKITVQAFSKYNDRNRIAAKQTNTQTQRHRKQQTYSIQAEKQKAYLQIDIEADLQWTNAHREVNKK